jgi:hypothetical protein
MWLVVGVHESGDPIGEEPVHILRRWTRPCCVAKRGKVRSLIGKDHEVRVAVEEIPQQRRAAPMMSAEEDGSAQPRYRLLALRVGRKHEASTPRFARRGSSVRGHLVQKKAPI